MSMYNDLTDAQKAELNNCFDDGEAEVFTNASNYIGWADEQEEEGFAETAGKVKRVIATF